MFGRATLCSAFFPDPFYVVEDCEGETIRACLVILSPISQDP